MVVTQKLLEEKAEIINIFNKKYLTPKVCLVENDINNSSIKGVYLLKYRALKRQLLSSKNGRP